MFNILVLATRNKGKLKEFKELLKDFPVEIRSLADFGPIPEVIEDGATFDDNAYKKALFTAKVLGLPAIADDSGLAVEALGGAPGVYSARYAGEKASDTENTAKLLKDMEGIANRKATFHCLISIAVPSGPALTYEGTCEGELLTAPRGDDGFGYDPVFFSPELGKTFAELSMAEKNQVSHRGRAMAEMAAEFEQVLKWLRQRLSEEKPAKPDHEQFAHNDWSEGIMVREVKLS
ncbi:MAG: Non-canonical purine NTP pyrophosphatase [Deltaproteobacteria bacterium RIFOXYD12_FULL_55_16]|nr:MAG: Non-canonical purine NTP pyrophosphatase [Deltaproteobacteria bacterium RIFOXYD12_FULL_55_16]